MKSSIVLRDPEPIQYGHKPQTANTEWIALLKKAKSKPGRWWEVRPAFETPGAAHSTAYDIKHGKRVGVPFGRWDATSRARTNEGGAVEGILFVRFLGER